MPCIPSVLYTVERVVVHVGSNPTRATKLIQILNGAIVQFPYHSLLKTISTGVVFGVFFTLALWFMMFPLTEIINN
jgi:hypothetical protein